MFAILQKYDFSSKSQQRQFNATDLIVVCDTAKVRFFKQITTTCRRNTHHRRLFAILQKYDFSSKSQLLQVHRLQVRCCLRYCKSTIFQANHNLFRKCKGFSSVVCDTAKVRFFKQITTKPQSMISEGRCLRYCKSTIFQANHNAERFGVHNAHVVCDTAKVRFFKQITTNSHTSILFICCLRYCKSTIFQANHNKGLCGQENQKVVCDTAKVRFFKQITTIITNIVATCCCLRYCKSTIFQANHNSLHANCSSLVLFAILQKYDFSSKSQLQR